MKKIAHVTKWFVSRLLSLLGFSFMLTGCDKWTDSPDAYGTPTTEYNIKGRVVNADNEGIPGIRVSADLESAFSNNPVLTDAEGNFSYTGQEFRNRSGLLPLKVEDVDGEENGSYADRSEQLNLTEAARKKNGSWIEVLTKTDIEITLEEAIE